MLLITIIFLSSFAYAGSELHQGLTHEEKRSYNFVVQTCHADLNSLATIVEAVRNDSLDYFSYFFNSDGTILPGQENIFTRRGVGKEVDQIINSYGYYLGLKECFPYDEKKRHLYTINILVFDAFGKLGVLSILGAGGASLYRGLGFLGNRLAVKPTVNILKKLKASDDFLGKVPAYMGRAGNVVFNGVSLSLITYYAYRIKKERDLIKQIYTEDVEYIRKSFYENLELYHQAIFLKEKARTPEDLVKIEALIETQRENVQYYIEELLSQNSLEPQERQRLMAVKESLKTRS